MWVVVAQNLGNSIGVKVESLKLCAAFFVFHSHIVAYYVWYCKPLWISCQEPLCQLMCSSSCRGLEHIIYNPPNALRNATIPTHLVSLAIAQFYSLALFIDAVFAVIVRPAH